MLSILSFIHRLLQGSIGLEGHDDHGGHGSLTGSGTDSRLTAALEAPTAASEEAVLAEVAAGHQQAQDRVRELEAAIAGLLSLKGDEEERRLVLSQMQTDLSKAKANALAYEEVLSTLSQPTLSATLADIGFHQQQPQLQLPDLQLHPDIYQQLQQQQQQFHQQQQQLHQQFHQQFQQLEQQQQHQQPFLALPTLLNFPETTTTTATGRRGSIAASDAASDGSRGSRGSTGPKRARQPRGPGGRVSSVSSVSSSVSSADASGSERFNSRAKASVRCRNFVINTAGPRTLVDVRGHDGQLIAHVQSTGAETVHIPLDTLHIANHILRVMTLLAGMPVEHPLFWTDGLRVVARRIVQSGLFDLTPSAHASLFGHRIQGNYETGELFCSHMTFYRALIRATKDAGADADAVVNSFWASMLLLVFIAFLDASEDYYQHTHGGEQGVFGTAAHLPKPQNRFGNPGRDEFDVDGKDRKTLAPGLEEGTVIHNISEMMSVPDTTIANTLRGAAFTSFSHPDGLVQMLLLLLTVLDVTSADGTRHQHTSIRQAMFIAMRNAGHVDDNWTLRKGEAASDKVAVTDLVPRYVKTQGRSVAPENRANAKGLMCQHKKNDFSPAAFFTSPDAAEPAGVFGVVQRIVRELPAAVRSVAPPPYNVGGSCDVGAGFLF